jgi:hypothetical protein
MSTILPVEEKTHLSDDETVILDKFLNDSHYEEEPEVPVTTQDSNEEVDPQSSTPQFEIKSILKKRKRSKDKSKESSTKDLSKETIHPKSESSYHDEDSMNEDLNSVAGSSSYHEDNAKKESSHDNSNSPDSSDNKCNSDNSNGDDCDKKWNGYIGVLILAIVITIFFLILCYPFVDVWFTSYVPNSTYRWLCRGLIFFILLVIILAIVLNFFF